MSKALKKESTQPVKQPDKKKPKEDEKHADHPIPFTVNVDEVVSAVQKSKTRKILIAMDGTEFSRKAVNWVHTNLLKPSDYVVLVSVWEEAMLEKLFQELDAEIIHPDVDITHSKHKQLNETFSHAKCMKNHENLYALLVEAGARTNPKSIGDELCTLAKTMGIDIMVCGTRGLGGVKKAFLGSVSTYISEQSSCTCIVVK
jgi:nucleotide-binding universal stress UspA family protein